MNRSSLLPWRLLRLAVGETQSEVPPAKPADEPL